MTDILKKYQYIWPSEDFTQASVKAWRREGNWFYRKMPESDIELLEDSRWPAFFPSPICIVTISHDDVTAVEKVVGPSIVNRFPYIAALSFCLNDISQRHHKRKHFIDLIELGGDIAIQFISPGPALDRIMKVILNTSECNSSKRLLEIGLTLRTGISNKAPIFNDAFLVYEGKLASSDHDLDGNEIFSEPYLDIGSHRVNYFEIEAIQLQRDIIEGSKQISWLSLPEWHPKDQERGFTNKVDSKNNYNYIKDYTPHYRFPAKDTISFVEDEFIGDMGVKYLRRQSHDDLRKLTNDDARWPCFFPSSLGLITAFSEDKVCAILPCGSTSIVSRHPMVIAICVSYAKINERYSPRASLDIIRKAGTFGCAVPFDNKQVVDAITYTGNISINDDKNKLFNSGLVCELDSLVPVLSGFPIFFECSVIKEKRLGTHAMLFGEVRRVMIRDDISVENPLKWIPWAEVVNSE